jgi:hypothetical protein
MLLFPLFGFVVVSRFFCQLSSDSRSGACKVTPPSTTSTWPVM